MRRAKATRCATWKKRIFHLHVFEGEHGIDNPDEDIVFDETVRGESRDVRYLKNQTADLQHALNKTRDELAAASSNENQQKAAISSLSENNSVLARRLSAVEQEADENLLQNQELQAQV